MEDYVYHVRDEEMINPSNGKSTIRIARFLKPCARTSHQAMAISSQNSTELEWPSKINLGWAQPSTKWQEWVERLAGSYGAVWNRTAICDAITSSTYEINCNKDLILGLVEHWCPDTNTFVFPWGEATVTLEDVAVLGGFPVSGEPVTAALRRDLVGIVEELKRQRLEMSKSRAKKSTHSAWMKTHMEKQSDNGVEEHAAFLSLWLSRYVFATNGRESMRKETFPIAALLSSGTTVALGPAVLANLYRSLTLLREQALCCSSDSVSFSGLFQLVQLWVFERFPGLAPASPNGLRPGEPRVARWHKLKSKSNIALVRSVLKLGENFTWRPYAVNLNNWRHLGYYREIEHVVYYGSSSFDLDEDLRSFLRFLSCSELVGLDCREKYMPHRVAMQFGYDQDLPGCYSSSGFNSNLDKVCFFVPSRSFEPGVSANYCKWWKETMLALQCPPNTVTEHSHKRKFGTTFEPIKNRLSTNAQRCGDSCNEVKAEIVVIEELQIMAKRKKSSGGAAKEGVVKNGGESSDIPIHVDDIIYIEEYVMRPQKVSFINLE